MGSDWRAGGKRGIEAPLDPGSVLSRLRNVGQAPDLWDFSNPDAADPTISPKSGWRMRLNQSDAEFGVIDEQGTDENGPYIKFSTGAKISYTSGGVLQLTL